ncbi:MAG: glycosyltransferase family protein [Candidatus Symbiothrix sp.]|jgi:spore coat polysaccharide biosynthesis protein SpsF|nr:glycosyltransferase family protein [Candidatus Symbiothrix sp.]
MLSFIIQARMGSTRLPSKILLPFYQDKSIFDLLLEKLQSHFQNIPIILATSENKENDFLEEKAKQKGISVFRGNETDVLSRFIAAAKSFNCQKIIRICSDNPFLDVSELQKLVDFSENNDYDYVSFLVDGKPSIKTHFGFWAEYVTLEALEQVNTLTKMPLYHEHVTNYIYENPDIFSIHFLNPNRKVLGRDDIRMTLDTHQDFEILSEIYEILSEKNVSLGISQIIDFLDNNPDYKTRMTQQIKQNTK